MTEIEKYIAQADRAAQLPRLNGEELGALRSLALLEPTMAVCRAFNYGAARAREEGTAARSPGPADDSIQAHQSCEKE